MKVMSLYDLVDTANQPLWVWVGLLVFFSPVLIAVAAAAALRWLFRKWRSGS